MQRACTDTCPSLEDHTHLEHFFTGSLTEPQGLQGLLQEDEGSKDSLSSSAPQRSPHSSAASVPDNKKHVPEMLFDECKQNVHLLQILRSFMKATERFMITWSILRSW